MDPNDILIMFVGCCMPSWSLFQFHDQVFTYSAFIPSKQDAPVSTIIGLRDDKFEKVLKF